MSKCSRCLLDETVPELTINDKGCCQYCDIYDRLCKNYPEGEKGQEQWNKILTEIKSTKGKYDCIVGISGGVDSTYTLLQAKKLGLNPLAVHCDTGWNTKAAVMNIKNACSKLNVELVTLVVDWEEYRDLLRSFLRASTPDADIPADMAALATLFKVAGKYKIKHILNGHSFRTEFMTPVGWTYYDGQYIKSVQKQFGNKKLKKFPNFTIAHYIRHVIIRRTKIVQFLNYIDYSKEMAKEVLVKELDWKDPGGHHHENSFTHFFQSYYLPTKFNIDKRKVKLSADVLSGRKTRENALDELKIDYPVDMEIVNYVIKKLQLSQEEFNQIMNKKPKSFFDYKTNANFISNVWWGIELLYKIGIVQDLIYHKYKMLTNIINKKRQQQ
jgi:N-acetyl sugar amidotransferase